MASYAWLPYGTNRWRVKTQHRAKADSLRLSEAKERKSERRARSEDRDGVFTPNVSMGARGRNQARADSSRLSVAKLAKGELRV